MVDNPTTIVDPAAAEDDTDNDGLFRKLRGWYRVDKAHKAEWKIEAREAFDMVAGRQYTEEEEAKLNQERRAAIVFNRIGPTLDSVAGMEIGNRRDVQYIPRTIGDAQGNEVLTAAAEFVRDQCGAEAEDSDAFYDALVCGEGWTDTRMEYDDNPDGDIEIEHIDPLEMLVDASARKRNYEDARRIHRTRQMPKSDAELMFQDVDPEDLDAAWARDETTKKPHNADPQWAYKQGDQGDKDSDTASDRMVTIVHCQWFDREPYHRVSFQGQVKNMTPGELGSFKTKVKKASTAAGIPHPEIQATPKLMRKVYKQAFLGAKVLETGPGAWPSDGTQCGGFTWTAITGKRDRNKGVFFGLVRPMKDPQRWANKWLSQTVHILNTNAKGGVFLEEGVTKDIRKFEASYARSDQITWMQTGALSGGGMQPKPQAEMPQGFPQLMQFAISAIRDTTGVSEEMLGLAERDQPNVLEDNRKQSSMANLATLFDSLKSYRQRQGKCMLYFITNFISDDRLIRIVGEEGAQYVPLMKQEGFTQYDVIVDDSPTAPNQKERIWSTLINLVGQVPNLGAALGPEDWLSLAKYSPLPSAVVAELSTNMQKKQAAQQPEQDQAKAIASAGAQAEVAKTQSESVKNQTQAQKNLAQAHQAANDQPQAPAAPPAPDPGVQQQQYLQSVKTMQEISHNNENQQLNVQKANAQIDNQHLRTFQVVKDLQRPDPIEAPRRP